MTSRILPTALLAMLLVASSAHARIFLKIHDLECQVEARDEAALTTALDKAAGSGMPGSLQFHLSCSTPFSAELDRLAASKRPLSSLAIEFRESEQEPVCYLKYKLDRCFVKSWSVSGDSAGRPAGGPAMLVLEYGKVQHALTFTEDVVD